MEEFIKIRIEELKVLKENLIQKHREELAKIDVRIDELNSMIGPNTMSFDDVDKTKLETVKKVSEVLNEGQPVKAEPKLESDNNYDENLDFSLDMEEESVPKKDTRRSTVEDDVDLDAMLNDL